MVGTALAVGHMPAAGEGRGVTVLAGAELRDNGGCSEGRRRGDGWEGDPSGGTAAQDGFLGETTPPPHHPH